MLAAHGGVQVSSTHSHFILTRADGSDFVLRGPMIALTFTVWCWTLQGLYFSMTGSLGVVRLVVGGFAFDTVVPQLVHKFLWVVFEQVRREPARHAHPAPSCAKRCDARTVR